jgi:hypothetical protein
VTIDVTTEIVIDRPRTVVADYGNARAWSVNITSVE